MIQTSKPACLFVNQHQSIDQLFGEMAKLRSLFPLYLLLLFSGTSLSVPFEVQDFSDSSLYISYEPSDKENCHLASECAGLSEIIVDIETRQAFQVSKCFSFP